MLNEMDGIGAHHQVIIIGATNRPDLLDSALTRPGRFDRLIYMPPPDKEARALISKIHLRGIKVLTDEAVPLNDAIKQTDNGGEVIDGPNNPYQILAAATERFSGAEIALVCTEARMSVLRRLIQEGRQVNDYRLHLDDLLQAVKKMTPRTSAETLNFYECYAAKT